MTSNTEDPGPGRSCPDSHVFYQRVHQPSSQCVACLPEPKNGQKVPATTKNCELWFGFAWGWCPELKMSRRMEIAPPQRPSVKPSPPFLIEMCTVRMTTSYTASPCGPNRCCWIQSSLKLFNMNESNSWPGTNTGSGSGTDTGSARVQALRRKRVHQPSGQELTVGNMSRGRLAPLLLPSDYVMAALWPVAFCTKIGSNYRRHRSFTLIRSRLRVLRSEDHNSEPTWNIPSLLGWVEEPHIGSIHSVGSWSEQSLIAKLRVTPPPL